MKGAKVVQNNLLLGVLGTAIPNALFLCDEIAFGKTSQCHASKKNHLQTCLCKSDGVAFQGTGSADDTKQTHNGQNVHHFLHLLLVNNDVSLLNCDTYPKDTCCPYQIFNGKVICMIEPVG